MGGRGSGGSSRGTSTVNNLLKAGGTRWQKNGLRQLCKQASGKRV